MNENLEARVYLLADQMYKQGRIGEPDKGPADELIKYLRENFVELPDLTKLGEAAEDAEWL